MTFTPQSKIRNPKCILICVGSELLRGKLNTHASHIARRLASIGLALHEENTVSDELPEITTAIQRALQRFEVLIISGGLGPTFDDLTREAVSNATGLPLLLSQLLLRGIQKKFKRARYRMPEANTRQAYLLKGAHAISNPVGTAPGQWLNLSSPAVSGRGSNMGSPPKAAGNDGPFLILLPGPPRELYPMLEASVLPHLKKQFPPPPIAEAHLHFVGVPESIVDAKVRPIIERAGFGVQFTILAHLGLVDLDIFVTGKTPTQAQTLRERVVRSVRQVVGKAWYGSDADYPLEKVVGDRFRKKRATLAVAESCTGGMLASRLTDIPGSSRYFVEGWVTYANSAKMRALGVPDTLLRKHGAVSKPVAEAMARGVRQHSQTTHGIGITGIAGPEGGSPKKPVGLVYVALASKTGVVCRKYYLGGNRDAVRQRAVLAALDLLRQI